MIDRHFSRRNKVPPDMTANEIACTAPFKHSNGAQSLNRREQCLFRALIGFQVKISASGALNGKTMSQLSAVTQTTGPARAQLEFLSKGHCQLALRSRRKWQLNSFCNLHSCPFTAQILFDVSCRQASTAPLPWKRAKQGLES